MADSPLQEPGRTTVNLVRSSHPWTEADSAAGFVLRYLAPMRRLLTIGLGSVEQADEALKLLLAHLVSVGFGEHRKGRLRDFLLKGIRSAAKSRLTEMSAEQRQQASPDEMTRGPGQWIKFWREGLLERAWRSLERQEHAEPELPLYSILHCATKHPNATPEILSAQLASDYGVSIDPQAISQRLGESRALFAQLIADEVAETLENPSSDDVKQEIAALGLAKAFSGVQVAEDDGS